jgi:predicted negative regulator of RcsB-dependent stress response
VNRSRIIAVFAVVLLGAALAVGYWLWQGQRATAMRSSSDRAAAVAAAAHSASGLPASTLSAQFWNPTSDTESDVQVQSSASPSFALSVTVRWDPARQRSVALATATVEPK